MTTPHPPIASDQAVIAAAQARIDEARAAVDEANGYMEHVKATIAQSADDVLGVNLSVKLHERTMSGKS